MCYFVRFFSKFDKFELWNDIYPPRFRSDMKKDLATRLTDP